MEKIHWKIQKSCHFTQTQEFDERKTIVSKKLNPKPYFFHFHNYLFNIVEYCRKFHQISTFFLFFDDFPIFGNPLNQNNYIIINKINQTLWKVWYFEFLSRIEYENIAKMNCFIMISQQRSNYSWEQSKFNRTVVFRKFHFSYHTL